MEKQARRQAGLPDQPDDHPRRFYQRTASSYIEARLTNEGMVIMLADGMLSARDGQKPSEALWEHRYVSSKHPAILAVRSDVIAVSGDHESDIIDFRSLAMDGKLVAKSTTAGISGSKAIPVDAAFHGDSLYVVCSMRATGRRKAHFGLLSNSLGLNVQRIVLGKTKPLWSRSVRTDASYACYPMPLTFGRDHVVVMGLDYGANQVSHVHVLKAATGEIAERINLSDAAGVAVRNPAARWRVIGPPVMTNGRLCVETIAGVSFHGGK